MARSFSNLNNFSCLENLRNIKQKIRETHRIQILIELVWWGLSGRGPPFHGGSRNCPGRTNQRSTTTGQQNIKRSCFWGHTLVPAWDIFCKIFPYFHIWQFIFLSHYHALRVRSLFFHTLKNMVDFWLDSPSPLLLYLPMNSRVNCLATLLKCYWHRYFSSSWGMKNSGYWKQRCAPVSLNLPWSWSRALKILSSSERFKKTWRALYRLV